MLVYKCGVSRAGKDQKGNPVALIFRLLMCEACKKEVVAVTMTLQCLRQKGWYRWAGASLTEVTKSPLFPKQRSYLERSNKSMKTFSPLFSLILSDTQKGTTTSLLLQVIL